MSNTEKKKRNFTGGRSNPTAAVLKQFADQMVKILENAKGANWKQGWLGVSSSMRGLPQNISGRPYSGGNSFFLIAHTSEKGYNTPVYMTFKQAKDQNLHVKSG